MNYAINESFEHSALSVVYDVDISHLIIVSLKEIANAAKASGGFGLGVLDQLYFAKKLYKEK